MPSGVQNMVSVSTKLATKPSSSMPRELKRVPARLHDSLDRSVKVDGLPLLLDRAGDAPAGTGIVAAKPRIAAMSRRVESSADLSCSESLLRKSMRGLIM